MQGNQITKQAHHSYVIRASQISPFLGNVEDILNLISHALFLCKRLKSHTANVFHLALFALSTNLSTGTCGLYTTTHKNLTKNRKLFADD